MDTGQVSAYLEETDLAQLLRDIEAKPLLVHDKPTVTVEWDIPSALPRVHTDRAKLRVVLTNLLSNAVKFTPEGSVTVRATSRDHGVEISVADTGVGIAPDVLPIVFECFRQGDGSATRRFGGVGLGLYIVRRLLDLLAGTITVESEVGRGSTFRVWLPLMPAPARAAPGQGPPTVGLNCS
jgi:signal transduction histidine kinase